MKAALERPSRFEFRSFSSGNYFSWSATLSIPACEHGSSQPGQPDTPTPPIVSSPTLIGRPPLSAITLVRWINGKFGLSLRRCSIVPDGARKLRAVQALRCRPHRDAFRGCAPGPELPVFVRARFDAVICSLRVHDLIRVILRSACDLLDGAKLVGARWKRVRNGFVGSHF